MSIPDRIAMELLYQLDHFGDEERMLRVLSTIEVVVTLFGSNNKFDLFSAYGRLVKSHDVEASVRRSLIEFEQRTPDSTALIDGIYTTAQLLENIGIWRGAEELLRRVEEMIAAANDRQRYCQVRNTRSGVLRLLAEYDEALEALTETLAITTELGDQELIAHTTGMIANVHYNRGEYRQSLEYGQRQIDYATETGNTRMLALGLSNMGLSYEAIGEYDRALDCFARGTVLAESVGNKSLLAANAINSGLTFSSKGEYEKALQALTSGLAISRELSDRSRIGIALGNIAIVYYELRDLDKAMSYSQQRQALAQELGDRRGLAYAAGNIALVHFETGEHDKAIEGYRRQLALAEEIGNRHLVSSALNSIGIIHTQQGDYPEALEHLHRARSIREEIGDRSGSSDAIGNIGLLHAELGDYEAAREHMELQRSIAVQIGDRRRACKAANDMADLYVSTGEYERAVDLYTIALGEARSLGVEHLVPHSLLGIARVIVETMSDLASIPATIGTALHDRPMQLDRAASIRIARAHLLEASTLAEKYDNNDQLLAATILIARLEAAEHDIDAALSRLRELVDNAKNDGQRADGRYWMWRLGGSDLNREDALRLYQRIVESKPKQQYKDRIKEMAGERQAGSDGTSS